MKMTEEQFDNHKFGKGQLVRTKNGGVFPILGVDFIKRKVKCLIFPPSDTKTINYQNIESISTERILWVNQSN